MNADPTRIVALLIAGCLGVVGCQTSNGAATDASGSTGTATEGSSSEAASDEGSDASDSGDTSAPSQCPADEDPTVQALQPLAEALESEVTPLSPTLGEYVAALDPAYEYTVVQQNSGPDYTLYTLSMTSLRWRAAEELTPSAWTHWIGLIVPDQTTTSKAHLIITGGKVGEDEPDLDLLPLVAPIAVQTGTPVAILGQIPAQPSMSPDRPDSMKEDTLVAYSWRQAMDTLDPTWAAYYPMVKASARAMDTVQAFMQDTVGTAPDGFIVTGFSKRGATAWLTAAVDPRVDAVVPGVFSALNLGDLAENQLRSYGDYAEAAVDYSNERVLQDIRSPEGRFLRRAVDPIHYRRALTMPHYIVQATGDEFFLADASRSFVDAIPGEALQRVIPNERHALEEQLDDNLDGLTAWYQAVLTDTPRPAITENVDESGRLTVTTDQEPTSVTLWTAHRDDRDFRFTSTGAIWEPTTLESTDGAAFAYAVELDQPAQGYTAHLVEFRFPGVEALEQLYSSSVYVTPTEYPMQLSGTVANPKSLQTWQCDLASAPDLDAALDDLLPILVRGVHLTTSQDVYDALLDTSTPEAQAQARCIATRLNIESGELDWYASANGAGYVWEHLATADLEQPGDAAMRCHTLNHLDADG